MAQGKFPGGITAGPRPAECTSGGRIRTGAGWAVRAWASCRNASPRRTRKKVEWSRPQSALGFRPFLAHLKRPSTRQNSETLRSRSIPATVCTKRRALFDSSCAFQALKRGMHGGTGIAGFNVARVPRSGTPDYFRTGRGRFDGLDLSPCGS